MIKARTGTHTHQEHRMIKYTINVRTISEANARGHWVKNFKLHHDQKLLALCNTVDALGKLVIGDALIGDGAKITITMTRVGGNKMDSDNLAASCKYIRDGIADALAPGLPPGRADGLERFTWKYEQRKGKRSEPKIEVMLERSMGHETAQNNTR